MLDVQGIYKSYEGQPLLKGITFRVEQGETVCLLGPSGSGKSTLLRLIAGLDQPDEGKILWGGKDLAGVPVHRRQFGLMFQEYALFPHQNVSENVAFGLRMRGVQAVERQARVEQALIQVNLGQFAQRRVTDLSGGEQQRVALARALAPRPRLLMLDEPLGALDRTLREQLLQELRDLLHQTGIPAIYVTHDQEEAYAIADRLVLLHEGQVVQDGIPSQVYHHPANPWVARFLGMNNLLEGKVCRLDPLWVQTELGDFEATSPGQKPQALGQAVTLLLRPNESRTEPPGSPLQGRVVDCTFRGEGFRVELECANGVHFQFGLGCAYPVGETLLLVLPPQAITCLMG
jgi:spermidine/putrescine transport system ATP-binding protein